MPPAVDIKQLSESQLRDYAAQMQAALAERDASIQQLETEKEAQLQARDSAIQRLEIEKARLTYEIAILQRHRFGARSETGSRSPQQSLLDDLVEEDVAVIEAELEKLDELFAQDRRRSAAAPAAATTIAAHRHPS